MACAPALFLTGRSAHAQATAASPPEAPMPALGSILPAADLAVLDGQPLLGGTGRLRTRSFEGQLLVLYWWASWCPFCAQVSPEMDKLWRSHAARGLQVLGLSIDRRPEEASAYLQRQGYGFPSVFMTAPLRSALAKPRGLPVTLVRGRRGEVLMAEAGQLFPEDVAAIARWL
jgi:thiol-disulfide isomerase/thioredoxin